MPDTLGSELEAFVKRYEMAFNTRDKEICCLYADTAELICGKKIAKGIGKIQFEIDFFFENDKMEETIGYIEVKEILWNVVVECSDGSKKIQMAVNYKLTHTNLSEEMKRTQFLLRRCTDGILILREISVSEP